MELNWLLAVDTSGAVGSVVLLHQGETPYAALLPSQKPAETLVTTIQDLLQAHHLTVADIDGYAVCLGPGSFTSLRIGLATVKGLAYVHQKPVVGISLSVPSTAAPDAASSEPRAVEVARSGYARLRRGEADNLVTLVPFYPPLMSS